MNQDRELVQHLLTDARQAINASNAQLALEHVVQALRLLHGNNAVLPALRAAAEQYHAQRAAPIDELSQLLAHVSIAAAQEAPAEQHMQQLQAPQQMDFAPLQQPQPQEFPWQQVQQQHQLPQQQVNWPQQAPHQQQQQQHFPGQGAQAASAAAEASSRPILEESGRGDFAQAAMADGSSWQCPHCSGVVPVQRQQAHLAFWCPTLQQQMG